MAGRCAHVLPGAGARYEAPISSARSRFCLLDMTATLVLYVSIYTCSNLEAFDAGAQKLQPNRTTLLEPFKVRRMSKVLICG